MRLRPVRLLAAAAIAILGLAPAAQASFPGRNGRLVVQPLHGRGLVLVSPTGSGVTRICASGPLCGTPATPRFSPDGASIAFATGSRPAVVALDGSCLWCLLGPPLTARTGSGPTFTAEGHAITFASRGRLVRTTLAGVTTTLAAPAATEPVSSVRGALAFVRAGVIWLARRGRAAVPLTAGTQPDFAPDGRSLVFVRAGWIWRIRLAGGRAVRLVRGSHPVPSPDGRDLAFVGGGGRIFVAGARGRHARPVPGVRGRAFDWQPLLRQTPPTCAVPAGAQALAATIAAVVTRVSPAAAPVGCLLATGRRTPLAVTAPVGAAGPPQLEQLVVAGRFAALATVTDVGRSTCSVAVTRFDLATGHADTLYSRACGSRPGTVDSLRLDTSGFAAWHASEQVEAAQPLVAVTCPAGNLCLAVDGSGNAASTQDPTGPASAWSVTKVAPTLAGVGCHGTTLCVGFAGGSVSVTGQPGGPPTRWSAPTAVDPGTLTDISCPADNLCAAVDNAGNVVTTSNPAGGTGAWQIVPVAGGQALTGISCPSTQLCVAVGAGGVVLTSTDPTGGSGAWSVTTAEPGVGLDGVSCPTATLCVASDSQGHLLATTTPAAGGPWTVTSTPAAPGPLGRPACPSVAFCLVADGHGNVIADHAPSSPAPVMTTENLASSLTDVACVPGSTTCLATDGAGDVLSSGAADGSSPWSVAGVDVPPCGVCVAEQLFATDDRGRQAVDTRLPGAGGQLAAVSLAGDATTLAWTDAGVLRTFALR